MRKNFDMDAAIRRALRESIEAHAHEWEPDFETGVGPVGDDAPFDKKVSGDVNECGDKEGCCPKCGKEKCECGDMNEGTIPGDSHEWEPGFETGVGPVGDDSPFTKAVNESLMDTNDWEEGSFGAPNHRKEGIAFADGADECGNGVVATSQKNSGEVISSDNLSEGEDEEDDDESTTGQFIKNTWNGLKRRWNQAKEEDMAKKGWVKADSVNSGNGGNTGAGESTAQAAPASAPAATADSAAKPAAQAAPQGPNEQPKAQPETGSKQPNQQTDDLTGTIKGLSDRLTKVEQAVSKIQQQKNTSNDSNIDPVTGKEAVYRESKEEEKDVIAEERDRFFNIINRIEKLYD